MTVTIKTSALVMPNILLGTKLLSASVIKPKKRIKLVAIIPKLSSSNFEPIIIFLYNTCMVSSTINPRQTTDVTEVNKFRSNLKR